MSYLVRFYQGQSHSIAHFVHQVNTIHGALCSQAPQPAEGSETRDGTWRVVETLPPNVRVCHICQKIQDKLDNPLPPQVERDLKKLALWDVNAAAHQRQKMLTLYRSKQKQKK